MSIMMWHSASERIPLTGFRTEATSAEEVHPAMRRACPSGWAVRWPAGQAAPMVRLWQQPAMLFGAGLVR